MSKPWDHRSARRPYRPEAAAVFGGCGLGMAGLRARMGHSVSMASMDLATCSVSEDGSGAVPAADAAACWPASLIT